MSSPTHFFTQALNKPGNEGWELVAALAKGEMYRLFFNRPKPQPPGAGSAAVGRGELGTGRAIPGRT